MVITAKYESTCPCCSKRIASGEKVEWSKGSKARHVTCQGSTAASVTRSSSPRRFNGRRYGWDGVVGSPSYYASGQYDEDS